MKIDVVADKREQASGGRLDSATERERGRERERERESGKTYLEAGSCSLGFFLFRTSVLQREKRRKRINQGNNRPLSSRGSFPFVTSPLKRYTRPRGVYTAQHSHCRGHRPSMPVGRQCSLPFALPSYRRRRRRRKRRSQRRSFPLLRAYVVLPVTFVNNHGQR